MADQQKPSQPQQQSAAPTTPAAESPKAAVELIKIQSTGDKSKVSPKDGVTIRSVMESEGN